MATRDHDLLIVTDATYSMGSFLTSLNKSLPEIIRMSALTGYFAHIGVVAFRDYTTDYDSSKRAEWSGWYGVSEAENAAATADDAAWPDDPRPSREELLAFAAGLEPLSGGDIPEATKTGLALAYSRMSADRHTVMLLFTDAPPHVRADPTFNYPREMATLSGPEGAAKYGPSAHLFTDWVGLTRLLRDEGDGGAGKSTTIYTIAPYTTQYTLGFLTYLAARTGGTCFEACVSCTQEDVSQLTMAVLLAWMGVKKAGTAVDDAADAADADSVLVRCCRFRSTEALDTLADEDDVRAVAFLGDPHNPHHSYRVSHRTGAGSELDSNIELVNVHGIDGLASHITARDQPVADFSQRYRVDATYRRLVVGSLDSLLRDDVAAITVNPIFGSLWRTVCSDRLNDARDRLITLFSQQVDAVQDQRTRQRLKDWLDASYDYAGEIRERCAAVPPELQFPCVYLDPTLDFSRQDTEDAEDEDGEEAQGAHAKGGTITAASAAPNHGLTRAELLEIGRSCDDRILRRMGRVLTRLTYVETAADLPSHIAAAADAVPRIPLALTRPENDNMFWRVLLHAIVPGTQLGPRPAALLAALSLRMGMARLRDAADAALVAHATRWNTLDIPETWNSSCLRLLLSADQDYVARHADDAPSAPSAPSVAPVLSEADRALFTTLVDYKLAEANFDTPLTARLGWHPDKTRAPLGPTTVCTACCFPRSVTIMADNGKCGLCYGGPSDYDADMVQANVHADDGPVTRVCWAECSVRACRSQYVVYNPDKLRVRAKCYFCRRDGIDLNGRRTSTSTPYVECATCLSRIIWPPAYRPADLDTAAYQCPACASAGRSGAIKTIVDVSTTAAELAAENGLDWLLRNDGGKIAQPFAHRSVFYTVSTAGVDGFADAVQVLPSRSLSPLMTPKPTPKPTPTLTLQGKRVRNVDALLDELTGWITARRAGGAACSLCFATPRTHASSALRRACGRHGCDQRICASCHAAWYGLNARGRILNVAALYCPFCRRQPAPGVVRAVRGADLATLGNLRAAVDNAGTWIYAWCRACGLAQPFAARECARGAPPDVQDWLCVDCEEAARARRQDAGADGGDGNDNDTGLRVRQCPGCGTPTEKLSGCDHIYCSVPGCDTHWCFACGEAVPSETIYAHMSKEHGGWYGGQAYPGEDADEYDEYDEYD